jgi:hypothetical protein
MNVETHIWSIKCRKKKLITQIAINLRDKFLNLVNQLFDNVVLQ